VALRAGNGRLAAALLDQLAEEFPAGALVQERTAARVLADCALGQVERAQSRAARFLARYPNSVHAERVRASCAGNQAPSGAEGH
jgi:outer membrane protein assembly factor BamD (BamD/ComL family)